tara:strand:- start:2949 stop:3287 length:339 start_codon:yes stop_codon:yes gene_type:complete
MGKTRKRMTSPKFAKKYAAARARRGVIEIDLTTGEEITEEETVQVITNKEPEPEAVEEVAVSTPEPQLQTIQIEEPPVNALKATKTTTTKKTTTKKTTTRRKRATKKTTSAD